MANQQEVLDISRVDYMPDEQDFIILMRRNQERIYRLAFQILGNVEEARDAAQETFIRAWQKLDALRRETSQAWLMKITVNLCLDWLRKRKFRGEFSENKGESQEDLDYQLPDPNPDPLEQCLGEETQTKVRKAISNLAPKYRAVVILRDLEGLSYQEIAEMLDVEVSKVKSNLFRGRRELRKFLRPFFEVSR